MITNLIPVTDNGPGPFVAGPDFYTSDTEIWIHVHALPESTPSGVYATTFHL